MTFIPPNIYHPLVYFYIFRGSSLFTKMLILTLVLYLLATPVSAETEEKKDGKSLSVFNVVREVVIKKTKKNGDQQSKDFGKEIEFFKEN